MKRFILVLASTLLLFLAGIRIPHSGLLLMPLVPQPVLWLGIANGRGSAVALVLVAMALLYALGGGGLALGYAPVALLAVLLLFFLGPGRSIEVVVGGAAGAMMLLVFGAFWALSGSFAEMTSALRTLLRENLENSLRIYERLGVPRENFELLHDRAHQIVETAIGVFPVLSFAILVFVILMSLLFLHRRLPGHPWLFSPTDLWAWKAPDLLIWVFITAGFVLLLSRWPAIKIVALNIFIGGGLFYFFQGLAIVAYYLHRRNIPFFLRSVVYLLIFFEQVFTLLVVGLGLFDLWGDFRRLNKGDLHPETF
jgi:uncharacterized protein YybS (DUF2232 family)